MSRARAAVGLVAVVAAGALLVSGGHEADPQTPAGLPGMPPPFLGVAVLGDGGLTAGIDAYGNVVDLRPQPAGRVLIENPADRQAAGTVPADTGIQPWVRLGDGRVPIWQADSVRQRYFPAMSALRTVALFGGRRIEVLQAARGQVLAMAVDGAGARVGIQVNAGLDCERQRAGRAVTLRCSTDGRDDGSPLDEVAGADRRWLARGRPLGASAPGWAERMYERSLLILRTFTGRNGAVAAGARDGWAYVWPRDASAVAIAFAAAGYRAEAERIARFLLGLGLEHAARFHGDGSPVPGRAAQGDAIGWVAAASEAAGFGSGRQAAHILAGGRPIPWRDRADYWEGEPGDYLGNAIASGERSVRHLYGAQLTTRLVREPSEADSGLDSAAAWAVRPFSMPRLYPAARATLNRLVAQGGPHGITPGEGWSGGEDPWSAPTAWTAWSLAALGERRQALQMMQALRRASTPAGDLPERVDARTGVPRSTTPLAWSHAFAILALRELWPSG
ncbi:MAG TPA: hypothetical protein VFY75_00170 [Solirubrobacterales bacterium]|nr:hypothetical protein [Solirubrobacterales bacterium]